MKQITYKKGYKYQLTYQFGIQIRPGLVDDLVVTDYLELDPDGWLIVDSGYAWDGPSGPAIDSHTFMRGSLIHDALYQLIREQRMGVENRLYADQLLRDMYLEDSIREVRGNFAKKLWIIAQNKTHRTRAWWIYRAVRRFGGLAVHPNGRKTLTAPKGIK